MSRGFTYTIVVLLLWLLLGCLAAEWIVQAPLLLVFGWLFHAIRVVPNLTVNIGGIGLMIVCVIAAAWLGHSLARWLWTGSGHASPWRPRWTVLGLLSILLLFASGMAATGVVHQTGWLITSPQPLLKPPRSRALALRVKCAANMRQIGAALRAYVADNGGAWPTSTEQFIVAVASGGISHPATLTCPGTSQERAGGATTREWVETATTRPSLHFSYVYVPGGVTLADGRRALLYEPFDNHDGEGMNVLSEDGHVEFVVDKAIVAVLTKRSTTTQPTTLRSE